jgi:hypothetical protein
MGTIAGHDFQETSTGRRCVAYASDKCGVCGMTWLHVRTATLKDKEAPFGFAHRGKLNDLEYAEIRCEAAREQLDIWEAVIDAASAGSR